MPGAPKEEGHSWFLESNGKNMKWDFSLINRYVSPLASCLSPLPLAARHKCRGYRAVSCEEVSVVYLHILLGSCSAHRLSLSLLSRPPHVFVFITNKKLVSNSCSNGEAQA